MSPRRYKLEQLAVALALPLTTTVGWLRDLFAYCPTCGRHERGQR